MPAPAHQLQRIDGKGVRRDPMGMGVRRDRVAVAVMGRAVLGVVARGNDDVDLNTIQYHRHVVAHRNADVRLREALRDHERNSRPPGAKLVRIQASAFDKGEIHWIRLTVEDHGAGMPPEIAAKVFDPFFTTKPRDKGTVLGLAISHGIVKEHRGKFGFDTAPGVGTRFHVDLRVNNGWTIGNAAGV